MRTSTYIRAASIAASDAADLFDAESVSGGPVPGSLTIRKAVRKLKQSTTLTNKAIALADQMESAAKTWQAVETFIRDGDGAINNLNSGDYIAIDADGQFVYRTFPDRSETVYDTASTALVRLVNSVPAVAEEPF